MSFNSVLEKVLVSVHHSTPLLPDALMSATQLSYDLLLEHHDEGSLHSAPRGRIITSRFSRILVDLNRSWEDPTRYPDYSMADLNGRRQTLWRRCPVVESIRRSLGDEEWRSYHQEILGALHSGVKLVVAWDNMPSIYRIGTGCEIGEPRVMPAIVLSNDGDFGLSTGSEVSTTCDPRFLDELAFELKNQLEIRKLPSTITLNTLDTRKRNDDCGFIAKNYSTRTNKSLPVSHEVQSIQVEYNRDLFREKDRASSLREAFEEALTKTLTLH